jgi:hypothetical protein
LPRLLKKTTAFSRFLNYSLFGNDRPFFCAPPSPIEEIRVSLGRETNSPLSNRDQAACKLILVIDKLLIAISSPSFLVTIIYPFVFPGESVPDAIQNAFYATFGWFGGALGTFFQVNQKEL